MAEQDGRAGQDGGGGARGGVGRWRGSEGVYEKAFAWPRTTLIFAARHRPGEAYVRVAGGWPRAAKPLWRARGGGTGRRASRRGMVHAPRWWTILITARHRPAGGWPWVWLLVCARPASGGDAGRPATRAQLPTSAGGSGVSGRPACDRERRRVDVRVRGRT